MGGVPREQKMLKGHLPRVIYHHVYKFTKISTSAFASTPHGRSWKAFGLWGWGSRELRVQAAKG